MTAPLPFRRLRRKAWRGGAQASVRAVPELPGGADAPARQIARGGVTALAIYVGGAGLTYCAQLLIARSIGAGGFGVYAYVFTWATMLAYCATLGFDVSMLRFVAAYQAQGAWGLLRGVIQYGERRALAFGVGIAVIGVLVVEVWADVRPDLARTFVVGLPLVPVLSLLLIRAAIVRAFGGIVSALAPNGLLRDGVLIGMIGFAGLIAGWRLSAPSVMAATLISAAAGLGLVSLAMRRRMPRAARKTAPEYAGSAWARVALPLVVLGFAEIAMNRAGVVLLGWVGRTTDAGIYALAYNVAFLAALPRTAINALLAPTISDLFVRGRKDALQALALRAAICTLLGAACIALPAAALAGPILSWFGQAFLAGVPALRVLLLAQVIVAGAGSQLHLLTMTGHERSAALLALGMAIINAALCAGLIGLFGLTGAAVATAATFVLWNVAMAALIWRRLRLSPGVLAAFQASTGTRAISAGANAD